MKTMLANQDHPNHHPPMDPPRRSLATPSYLGGMVNDARVLCRAWYIFKPPCRSAHDVQHIAEQKSRSGMQPRLHGLRTASMHDDKNTTHAPHAYELLPTNHDVVYVQATFGYLHAPKHRTKVPLRCRWGGMSFYIPPFGRAFLRRHRVDVMSSVPTVEHEE